MDWFSDFWAALQHGSAFPLTFTTLLFAALFTVLLLLVVLAGRWPNVRTGLLLAFSLFFYWKGGGAFVLLMSATALLDYTMGRIIGYTHSGKLKSETQAAWLRNSALGLSLAVNLGLLAYFKYANFFLSTWLGLTQPEATFVPLQILLPLGISFYTFRSLSYVLDVHREMMDPETNFLRYWLYVGFFANLLAGPITRAEPFLEQVKKPFQLSAADSGEAFWLFFTGLFKKLVIADYLAANLVDRVFENPGAYAGFENLMAVIGYSMQLFADFSGYTDMALGVALLLGIRLAGNFREPFKATSVSDFWRRWHISLSTWFNEYVYMPLTFSWRTVGKVGILSAVVLTFILSGLWHGPAWTFVLWGLLHGVAIAVEVGLQPLRSKWAQQLPKGLYMGISTLLTFAFLCVTYVLFRSANLTQAGIMYSQILDKFQPEVAGQWVIAYAGPAAMLAFGFALHFTPTAWKHGLKRWFVGSPWVVQAVLCALAVILIYQARIADAQPFVYLQF